MKYATDYTIKFENGYTINKEVKGYKSWAQAYAIAKKVALQMNLGAFQIFIHGTIE